MADVFHVENRTSLGKRRTRRLRKAGQIPVVLYGGGGESVSLSVPEEEIATAIRQGSRFVNLEGASTDSALIREIQWDPMGSEVLHLDLTRVRADERVEVEVSIELRGEAPGAKTGGVVKQQLFAARVECPVISIPDKIDVSINTLELEGEIKVGSLEWPEGVNCLTDAETLVVSCVAAAEEGDEEASPVDMSAEPEVIGRKADEDEAYDS